MAYREIGLGTGGVGVRLTIVEMEGGYFNILLPGFLVFVADFSVLGCQAQRQGRGL